MPPPTRATTPQRTAVRIASSQNARWKDLRRRLLHPARIPDGRIAIEGLHLIEEAQRSGLEFETLFVREDVQAAMQRFSAHEVCVVARNVFNQGSATETPQGVAALVRMPAAQLDAVLGAASPLLVVLDGLQDPGNLGAIVRSAEAFGAAGVLLLPGTVCPWNAKALRGSAGSLFRVPVLQMQTEEALVALRAHAITICAAVARDGVDVATARLDRPVALWIGNEGAGISAATLAQADLRVQIPCPGPVESLNAAVAASILLYAAAQQRMPQARRTAARP
jgi:TrmH family RNA methyltransferase